MSEIPRRYSVADDLNRPYHLRIGPKLDVFLDGKPATRVISFDVDAGTLERYQTDESGRIVLDRARDIAPTETLSGKIEVCWRPDCLG